VPTERERTGANDQGQLVVSGRSRD